MTGHVIIESSQTTVNHELALMPFLGHSFGKGHIHFVAGPVVFGTKSNIYRAIGFGKIDGVHLDVTQTPVNFSDSTWMWAVPRNLG